ILAHGHFCKHFAKAPVQDGDHLVNLFGRRDERRPKGEPVRIEAAQEAVLQSAAADPNTESRLRRKGLLRGRVAHKLDALEEAFAADIADRAMLPGQALEADPQPRSLSAGIGAQVVFQDLLKDSQSRGARDRVAFERVAFDKAWISGDRPPEGIANLLAANHRR